MPPSSSICLPEVREKNYSELKQMFLERYYNPRVIYGAMNKTKTKISREYALQKIVKKINILRLFMVVS